jgi:hypothetical protein
MKLRNTMIRRARLVLLVLAALTASLVIAACGSSASTSTKSTTSSPAAASASGSTSAIRTAFVKCLQEHGVTMPAHPPGSGPSGTQSGRPPGAGSGSANPTRQAAFKACGAPGQHAKTE